MLRAVVIALSCLLLAGCGGRSGAPNIHQGDTPASPSIQELTAALQADFERLGIDPAKAVGAAPQGAENAVFDLSAQVIDPDGEGGEPPTGIELKWTEQLIGDYDQNGLVNYSDLTPIGQQWQQVVTYDDPALHGGFQWWPTGDSDDDGNTGSADAPSASAARPGRRGRSQTGPGRVGGPPLRRMPTVSRWSQQLLPEGSGAQNWRRARIDGSRDGLIGLRDITPIAQHWLEQLSGYRVYLKRDGEEEYSLQELVTAEFDNLLPMRYSYTLPVDTRGLHRIYVVAYDDKSGSEGPASAAVYVDVDTGSINYAPFAWLSVEPSFAGAPAQIALNASASYDVYGSIAAYRWDFDGDGVVDWVSTDPVPEASSGGTVEEITPGVDGIVAVTYTEGSAEWLHPSVVAVDDQDAESVAAIAKLGISGWESTVLNASLDDALIRFRPTVISIDPDSGDIVVAATTTISELHGGESYRGLWFIRETDSGPWIEEALQLPDGYHKHSSIVARDIVWNESGQPLILFTCQAGSRKRAFAAHRETGGVWVNTLVWDTSQPEHAGGGCSYLGEVDQREPGPFAVLIGEWPTDKQDPYSGLDHHYRSYVAFHEQGEWSVEYTGYDAAESDDLIIRIQGISREQLYCYFRVIEDMSGGVWRAQWEDGAGFVNPQRMDDGSLSFPSPYTYCREAITASDGSAVTVWQAIPSAGDQTWWMITMRDGECGQVNLSELIDDSSSQVSNVCTLYSGRSTIGMSVRLLQSEQDGSKWEHWRREGGQWIREGMEERLWDGAYSQWVCDGELDSRAEPVVLSSFTIGFRLKQTIGFDYVYGYAKRIDPRLK